MIVIQYNNNNIYNDKLGSVYSDICTPKKYSLLTKFLPKLSREQEIFALKKVPSFVHYKVT